MRITYLIVLNLIKRHLRIFLLFATALFIAIFLQFKFNFLNMGLNTVSEGLIGTYQEHDLPSEVTRLLSQGLVESDESGRFVPNLATKWDVNDDATDYKFYLKDNLKWSNGAQLKSSDLSFVIPNTEVSFPDDKTVEFRLKESYSAFPSLLTKPLLKKETLMGIGPYKVGSIQKSRIFITKIVLDSAKSDLPKVVIRFYPNEKTANVGFYLGEVESLLGVNNKSLSNQTTIKLNSKVDYTKLVAVFYNTKDSVLGNRSLRQALSFAAPKISGEVEANNPYPPTSWAFNRSSKNYLEKNDDAKAAIERAKSTANVEDLKKDIVLTTTQQLEEVGKKIVSSWRGIGINAILRVESGIPQNFQALLITQAIPADPDQYFLWHETQTETNLTQYAQKRADKDLEDGRKLLKEDERRDKYFDFQKVLLEDSPATFLYFPKLNVLYLKKAENKLNKVLPLQFNKLIRR